MSVLVPPLKLSLDLSDELAGLPVVSLAESRTPASLHQVADALVHQDRYRKRDVTGDDIDETFCNFLVREALKMLGLQLPRLRANEYQSYFSRPEAIADGWTWLPLWCARSLAQVGHPVVSAQFNPAGSGHVALLMPAKTDADRDLARRANSAWIAQAGISNFAYGLLRQGFNPTRPVVHFAHP